MTIVTYIIIFFFSLIGSVVSIPYLIKYLTYSNIVDRPGTRRINKNIIPRMGGIVIYAAVSVTMFAFYKNINFSRPLILASLAIVIVGIWDDIKGLKWSYKLAIQYLAALLLISFFHPLFEEIEFFGLILPFPLNYIILVLFIMGAINSINFMDGLDGLVAGFTLQISWMIIILASLSGNQFLLIIITALLGSILGFLKYNAYPAKIFLGDTGSLTIGLFLVFGAMYISLDYRKELLDLTFPTMLLGVPIIDASKVIIIRIKEKKSPFYPDQNHLHHIIINGKVRHKITVAYILFLSSMFAMDALIYIKLNEFLSIIIFFTLGFVLFFTKQMLPAAAKIKLLIVFKNRIISLIEKRFVQFYEMFLFVSVPSVIAIILFLFPISSKMNFKELIAIFVSIIIMFIASFIRRSQNDYLKDIYVLFNFSIFFVIGNFSSSIITNNESGHVVYKYLMLVSLILLSVLFIVFLFKRESQNSEGKVFLSGLDITLIIILISFYVFTIIMPNNKFGFVEINFWETIIIFLWYKMVVYLDKKLSNTLYYLSYALPILSIISIIIFSK